MAEQPRPTRTVPAAQTPLNSLPAQPYPGQPVCKYCKTPLPRERAGTLFCGSEVCETRRTQAAVRALEKQQWDEFVQEQIDAVEQSADHLVAAVDAAGGELKDLPIGVVPQQPEPLIKLPDWRRSEFEAYLEGVVEESFQREPPEDTLDGRVKAEAPEMGVIDATCGTCWGRCCLLGGARNAFISKITIDVFRVRNPEMSQEQVLKFYLDKIPEETIQHSCVYHGEMGCTLERTERANICNSYHCLQQTEIYKRMKKTGARRAIIISNAPQKSPRIGIFNEDAGHQIFEPGSDAPAPDPDRSEQVAAHAISQVPAKMPEAGRPPEYPEEQSCKWCGTLLNVHQAATTRSCGAAFCEQRRLNALYSEDA